jgi:hypothetical protein
MRINDIIIAMGRVIITTKEDLIWKRNIVVTRRTMTISSINLSLKTAIALLIKLDLS